MSSKHKRRILNLPLKLVLTQEGSEFFIKQNRKLMKLKLAEHVEDYGIALDAFAPKTVQGLLLSGYVSLIEVSPPEFASSRQIGRAHV